MNHLEAYMIEAAIFFIKTRQVDSKVGVAIQLKHFDAKNLKWRM